MTYITEEFEKAMDVGNLAAVMSVMDHVHHCTNVTVLHATLAELHGADNLPAADLIAAINRRIAQLEREAYLAVQADTQRQLEANRKVEKNEIPVPPTSEDSLDGPP